MDTLRSGAIALAVLVGSAVAAVPAAADGGRHARSAHYPSIWQGLYGGVHLGHGEADPADGFVGGVQIGYNWQSGQIVYGLEADVSFADISFQQSFMGLSVSGSIDWMATARGRLGFLVTPGILAYGTAGFGFASGAGSVSFPGFRFSDGDTESDFVFGVGVEGKLSESMTLRLEYLAFSDLDIDVVRAGLNFKLGR